jgi:hypothetical protein
MLDGSNSFVGVGEPSQVLTETAPHGRHAEAVRVRTADRGVGKGAHAGPVEVLALL